MTQSKVYESLVEDGLSRVVSASETSYRDAWTEHALPRESNLLAMAISGGLIADRVAWVFVAGYQAACRHVFPSAALRSWVSYAATEDRERDSPLPGVRLSGTPSAGTLSGYKVWIGAARSVEQLVVRVGTGPEATYFVVDRDRHGLTIDPKRRDFLAGLSQGRARFEETPVTDADIVDGSRIGLLEFVEPLYIYSAFCGFVLGGNSEPDLVAGCHDCLDAVELALASTRVGGISPADLDRASTLALDLLARLAGNRAGAAGHWETDQRIVAMYSSQIDVDIPH